MQKLATVFETREVQLNVFLFLDNCGNIEERKGSLMRNPLGLNGKVMEK